jgi:hypothetical protein
MWNSSHPSALRGHSRCIALWQDRSLCSSCSSAPSRRRGTVPEVLRCGPVVKSTSAFFHEVRDRKLVLEFRWPRQAQCCRWQQHHAEVGASRLSPCAHNRSLRSPGRLARVTCKTRAVGRLRAVDDGDNRHHSAARRTHSLVELRGCRNRQLAGNMTTQR